MTIMFFGNVYHISPFLPWNDIGAVLCVGSKPWFRLEISDGWSHPSELVFSTRRVTLRNIQGQ